MWSFIDHSQWMTTVNENWTIIRDDDYCIFQPEACPKALFIKEIRLKGVGGGKQMWMWWKQCGRPRMGGGDHKQDVHKSKIFCVSKFKTQEKHPPSCPPTSVSQNILHFGRCARYDPIRTSVDGEGEYECASNKSFVTAFIFKCYYFPCIVLIFCEGRNEILLLWRSMHFVLLVITEKH